MTDSGFRLGIDFGTSNTVAVLRWPDGRVKALLFDGAPLLPSAVYLADDGTILTGRDAVHSARLHPHRFEPYPKRRVDEETVYLGDREIPSSELIASVLRRVATEAQRVGGDLPGAVTITHPAAWGSHRRELLAGAAMAAGLPAPLLVPEPVAAASYFVGTVGTRLPVGGSAVVYDFGAGTFDASVVRRTAAGGFDVLAAEGLTDAGGLDVDAAIVTFLGQQLAGRDPGLWHRLSQPADETDRRAAWQLWEDARQAKETLSRAATTYVHVPLFNESVPLGREQLEGLARPILDRTVAATLTAVSSAGLTPPQLAAVFLVGGSSRIPLAATLLHRGFGTAPAAIEQPELVVGEGALQLAPRAGRAVVPPPVPGDNHGGTGAAMPGSPMAPGPVSPAPHSTPGPVSVPPPGPVSAPPHTGPPFPGQPGHGPRAPMPAGQGPHGQVPAGHGPHGQVPAGQGPHGGGRAFPGGGPVQPGYPTLPGPDAFATRPPRRRSKAPLVGGLVAAGVALLVLAGVVIFELIPKERKPDGPGGQVAAACGYKIAYLGVLSGSSGSDGVTIRNAAQLALDKYNRAHAGCTAELVEFDTKGDKDEAARYAGQIAKDDRILGVVGPIWFEEAQQVMPILDAAGVTSISPYLSRSNLSRKGWKTFHRTVGTDADQAAAGARYLTDVWRAKRVFVVAESDEFSAATASEVRLRLNTAFTGRADIAGTETDYAPVVAQVTAANADAVYFAGYHDAGGRFVKQLRAAEPSLKIAAWDRVFTDAFFQGAGNDAAEGVVLTCPCVPPGEARENFANDYRDRYTQPGYYGPEAFDATNALLAALGAGKSTRADVLAFVKAYDGAGVSRRIKFTADGDLDNTTPTVWAYQVRGGTVYKDQVMTVS